MAAEQKNGISSASSTFSIPAKEAEVGVTNGPNSSSSSSLPEYSLVDEGGVFGNSTNTALKNYYKPIDSYEGAHRYDPTATWSEQEEKAIVRKIDWRIASWCCLMFFALQLDRGNISQALSDNMLDDLGLTTDQYNWGQTVFYISFLLAELPSQLVSKKLGPDRWIPIQMCAWSIVASCQSKLNGYSSFMICRTLIGLIEGGFIADVILYLSYFYKTKELPSRLSWFWTAYMGTQIIAAFLAFGILRLRGVHGMEGWRWLFALEGSFTALIGILSWFYMPPSPTQTKGGLRGPDGWFSEREEIIMVNRVLRDDPSKGDMHNRQAVTPALLWSSLKDYDMWPIYIIGLTWTIPSGPMSSYLTLVLRSMGFSTLTTNLLTVPAQALFIIILLSITWLSERINQRLLLGVAGQIWVLIPIVVLAVLPADAPKWGRYAACIFVVGQVYVHAILVSLTSRNAGSVRTRTVGSAVYNMTVQTGSIISSNIYRSDDAPLYRRGNRVLIGVACMNIALFILAKLYYMWKNKRRDRIWNAMSLEEKEIYLKTTEDKGNKRLDFRFAH
ncbi:major facilitator superfamily domain-containing protein [Sphaerosporella brunnea]|uniref:Major facilitator superfamily domain-containing protein n=1 Tax=Sphaerosporella brunnea TaxID=1250544 RepID=A0A5J5F5E4_9PEZI|nr:major facilitator superfamily domain-containing protein [Sphaerosporella brunnea]